MEPMSVLVQNDAQGGIKYDTIPFHDSIARFSWSIEAKMQSASTVRVYLSGYFFPSWTRICMAIAERFARYRIRESLENKSFYDSVQFEGEDPRDVRLSLEYLRYHYPNAVKSAQYAIRQKLAGARRKAEDEEFNRL